MTGAMGAPWAAMGAPGAMEGVIMAWGAMGAMEGAMEGAMACGGAKPWQSRALKPGELDRFFTAHLATWDVHGDLLGDSL